MKLLLAITTYNRPELLLELLKDIKRERGDHDIVLHVYNDASIENYSRVESYLKSNFENHSYVRLATNFGKENYYDLINKIFENAKNEEWDYFFQLPDDCTLVPGFFDEAISTWKNIPDPKKICLSTLLIEERLTKENWTGVLPVDVEIKDGRVIKTQWNDMCYMCERSFFIALNWKIEAISKARWKNDPNKSSGVGSQISIRLHTAGYSMYHTWTSLLVMRNHPSQMNQSEREIHPATSLHRKLHEHIYAGMASVAGREAAMIDAVKSLYDQVDTLYVYLNNYETVPSFLQKKPKIKVFRSQDHGDMGDAGKFFNVENCSGYFFSVDDDIIYPSDYVARTVEHIESYQRRYIVTYHGALIPGRITSYYRGRQQFHCTSDQTKDIPVHVGGTGVMAFHTSLLKVSYGDFKVENMADIWFSLLAQQQKVGMICLKRSRGWIRLSDKTNQSETIYAKKRNNDDYQTDVVNSVKSWTLYTTLGGENESEYVVTKDTRPIISVVVTFHNQFEFVRECLDGFLQQDIMVPYEIIAVIDASTDGTAAYIMRKYDRVQIVEVDYKDASKSRNHGKRMAKGNYIVFFDGDDYPYKLFLSTLYQALEADPTKDFAYSRFGSLMFGLSKELLPTRGTYEWTDALAEVDSISSTPMMLRADVARKVDFVEGIHLMEDYAFHCELFKHKAVGVHIREELWYYRIHKGSKWTGDAKERSKKILKTLNKKYGREPKENGLVLCSLISRQDIIDEYLEGITKLELPPFTTWFVFIDSNDTYFIDRTIHKINKMSMYGTRIYVTNEPNKVTSKDFCERGTRIGRNVKTIINTVARLGFKEMLMIEDDTIAPPDTYEKLKKHDVDFASGVEVSRAQSRHLGAGSIYEKEGEIVLRITPKWKESGTLAVNSCGWFCFLARVDAIKDIDMTCLAEREIGPDQMFVYDLTQAGGRALIDFSVPCLHWCPMRMRWLHPKDSISYRWDFAKNLEGKWEKTTTFL